MKKIIAAITALTMLCTAVSCSQKTKETTLTVPEYTEDGKPIVKVGTTDWLDPLFNDKLAKPKDIEIQIIDYSAGIELPESYGGSEFQNYLDAIQRNMDTAFIKGEIPDIMLLAPEYMSKLIRQGMMTDLFELMEQYDGIKREDFTDCALEGMTIDGKLPAFIESYNLVTCVAKTKYVPKEYESWTPEQAMDFYGKMPENATFCQYDSQSSLADYMLKKEILSCVDVNNSTCNIGDSFVKLLDFCGNTPITPDRDFDFASADDADFEFFIKEEEAKGLNDAQLVYGLTINGFNSQLAQDTYGYLNREDVTFVGFPSEDGNGAIIEPNGPMIGICEGSGNKELAWKLVNLMVKHRKPLEKNMSDGTRGLSVFKEQYQKEYDLPDDYNNSINREIHFPFAYNEIEKIPQEYKDMLSDYIMSVPVDPYMSNSVTSIAAEEYAPVVNGERSAEDAANIIRNRIETYLSERN